MPEISGIQKYIFIISVNVFQFFFDLLSLVCMNIIYTARDVILRHTLSKSQARHSQSSVP